MSAVEKTINDLASDTLGNLGYRIVRILLQGSNQKTLQVMIERIDEQPISIEDCTLVSHNISALLDVEDVIKTKYLLEVTSPGIERPLVRIEDFIKNIGNDIRLTLIEPYNNSTKMKATIMEVNSPLISLMLLDKKEKVELSFDNIKTANIMLSDNLFKQILNKKGAENL